MYPVKGEGMNTHDPRAVKRLQIKAMFDTEKKKKQEKALTKQQLREGLCRRVIETMNEEKELERGLLL